MVISTHFYGLPTDMIAERLNTNRNNIYKIIYDARKKVRRCLLSSGISPSYVLAVFGNDVSSQRTLDSSAVE